MLLAFERADYKYGFRGLRTGPLTDGFETEFRDKPPAPTKDSEDTPETCKAIGLRATTLSCSIFQTIRSLKFSRLNIENSVAIMWHRGFDTMTVDVASSVSELKEKSKFRWFLPSR